MSVEIAAVAAEGGSGTIASCSSKAAGTSKRTDRRGHESFASSPVGTVDPVVRAINTIMYGMMVHFGTMWWIGGVDDRSGSNIECSSFLFKLLLLHEYWIYLQHSNVLGNPWCQRLDRQYGIALLKQNQHWAIAGTLSAYWCRESLGLLLCLPIIFVKRSSWIPYFIVYSLIYHNIKSRGVRQDALQRSSSSLGIMRVVMDKFYLNTPKEQVLTAGRLFLQALDTWIHYSVIRDMLQLNGHMAGYLHGLFIVWVGHAALNQYFRCSTASVMVQAWHSMTTSTRTRGNPAGVTTVSGNNKMQVIDRLPKVSNTTRQQDQEDNDEDTEAESTSGGGNSDEEALSEDHSEQGFIVRKLLRSGRVPAELKGRQGTATVGVDTAVRLETVAAILSSISLLGLGRAPFQAMSLNDQSLDVRAMLSSVSFLGLGRGPLQGMSLYIQLLGIREVDMRSMVSVLVFGWTYAGLLYGIWSWFLATNKTKATFTAYSRARARQRSMLQLVDLGLLVAEALSTPGYIGWTLALLITFKSYLQAARIPRPPILWTLFRFVEFSGKLVLLRRIVALSNVRLLALTETTISLAWATWVVSTPTLTPCEAASRACSAPYTAEDVTDVVFLGHPAELVDCWTLWLVPYSLEERWKAPLWALPLWPLHYLVGWYVCNWRQRLFGDSASFFNCDDVLYRGIRMQTWTAAHFGRHFATHPHQVKRNIEAAARHAQAKGIKVLCLGALNKAESINAGGVGVAKALGPDSNLSLIHGNHLTAAVVLETTIQCLGKKAKVFLTGASSKVGWAVAQALRDRYSYEVLCHSTDPGRRKFFQEQGFQAASKLSEGTLYSKYWIVGKYDFAVATWIPQDAVAIVFCVPHSLESRHDVRIVEAGTLHLDQDSLDRPRRFTNKLKGIEIFACHAAAVVAAYRLKQPRPPEARIVETGPVDPKTMNDWLEDAKSLGFSIPGGQHVLNASQPNTNTPPVVIVGAGPSGLAVAASLVRRNISSLVLEAQTDTSAFGSWQHHFSGLEVTSQKKWCQLPGLPMANDDFPGEYISAKDYQRYLELYANRFQLQVRRGAEVLSIEKGTNAERPWVVKYKSSSNDERTVEASAVVVATGKHRLAQRDTDDNLTKRLSEAAIPVLHTTDLRTDETWSQVMNVASKGRLVVVGLGNSAADIATAVLQESSSAQIHVSTRTVPPVFPRAAWFLRVDTLGHYFVRWLPSRVEDLAVHLLWWGIPNSQICNNAFPSHLPRWKRIQGRVPVVDKYGHLAQGFASGQLVGHGPVVEVVKDKKTLRFDDRRRAASDAATVVAVDLVLLATGYQKDCIVTREDRLNGLYKCGFGNDRFLPLRSIGEQAQVIAKEIAADYYCCK